MCVNWAGQQRSGRPLLSLLGNIPMRTLSLLRCAVLLVLGCTCAFAQKKDELQQLRTKADAHFAKQQWAQAAGLYAQIVKADPGAADAWFNLGYTSHVDGKYDKAIEAYRHCLESGFASTAAYNIACAYALKKENANALDWLHKAAEKGFMQVSLVQQDGDLASLRGEKKYADALAVMERNAHPCMHNDNYRSLDFWIGEWNVRTAQGQPAGENSIQMLTDGCVVAEYYHRDDYAGTSISMYDKKEKRWRQIWSDNQGGVTEFTGEQTDTGMRFTATGKTMDGKTVTKRTTLSALGPDKVRQLAEYTTDDGATWSVMYDLMYIRKNASTTHIE